MEQSEIERCEQIIGHHFRDPQLLELALTHASVALTRLESNERLEFLGDAVLGLVVCHALYQNHAELMEGEMTKIKSAVVSRHTCAEIAQETGISELLLLGRGISRPDGLPTSVTAAVFESIIGAVYLDGGMQAATEFILRPILPKIEQAIASRHQRNYKSLLQQHSQQRWGVTPSYHLLDEKGPDHSRCFEIAVEIRGKYFRSAWGQNKKQAEQNAAHNALVELGLLDEAGNPAPKTTS